MRSSTESVNDNYSLVSGFDSSTWAGENVYDIFENEERIVAEDSVV